MATTNRELVLAAINNKSAKYVAADSIKSAYATVAIVEAVEENWVIMGHIVPRATVYFSDNTCIRTKSKHVIATIGALADDPVLIDNGFAVIIADKVKFGKEPTLYANGKTYDTLTMTVGDE